MVSWSHKDPEQRMPENFAVKMSMGKIFIIVCKNHFTFTYEYKVYILMSSELTDFGRWKKEKKNKLIICENSRGLWQLRQTFLILHTEPYGKTKVVYWFFCVFNNRKVVLNCYAITQICKLNLDINKKKIAVSLISWHW